MRETEREPERQRQSIREWVILGTGSLERGSIEEQFKIDKVGRICFEAEPNKGYATGK